MKTFQCIITGLFLLIITSCQDQPIELRASDYLIFGHFYGECAGEGCIEIFKLEQDRLFEDKRDVYPNATDFYKGDYVELSTQKFLITKDIVDSFPKELLDEKNRVIGQPDAGDWGGFYVEYNYKGTRQFWLLDKAKSNVPAKYHGFMDVLNAKISQLK